MSRSPATPARPSRPGRRLWKACRRGAQWLLVIGAVSVVLTLQYIAARINEEVRVRVQAKLAQLLPDYEVRVRAARLALGEGLEIRGVVVLAPGDDANDPLLQVDEIFLACSAELKDLLRTPDVRSVVVRRPEARLARGADGAWNVERLAALLKPRDAPLVKIPELRVEGGVLHVVDESKSPPTSWTLRDLEIAALPQWSEPVGAQPPRLMLQLEGSCRADYVRRASGRGTLFLDDRSWLGEASVEGFELCPELLAAAPHWPSSLPGLPTLPEVRASIDLSGRADFAPTRPRPLNWSARATIQRGTVADSRLTLPIRDLEASVAADPNGLVLERIAAKQGDASLEASGQAWGWALTSPCQVQGKVVALPLDRQLLALLPKKPIDVVQDYDPAGRVDVRFVVGFDGTRWSPDVSLDWQDLSFRHIKFPYRLQRGWGSTRFVSGTLTTKITAFAATQPVVIEAEIKNPGPEAHATATIRGKNLRIDRDLWLAMTPRVSQVVQTMHPEGEFDLAADISRPPGWGQPTEMKVTAQIVRGSIKYDKFPYPLTQIRGTVFGHGIIYPKVNEEIRPAQWAWEFRDLVGRNASTEVRLDGRLSPPKDGSVLSLSVRAFEAVLDDELRQALPGAAQAAWDQIRPRGRAHIFASVGVAPGIEPVIHCRIDPLQAAVDLVAFPYRLEGLTGEIFYEKDLVRFQKLRAFHGDVTVTAEGTWRADGPNGWRLHFYRLTGDGLRLDREGGDREFAAALPTAVRGAIEPLALGGLVDMSGELEIAGEKTPGRPVRAAWDARLVCHRASVNAPLAVTNVYGGLTLRGAFDGATTFVDGDLDLDSADYNGLQFTQIRGPFSVDARQVVFGSLEALRPDRKPGPLPAGERPVSAKLVDGTVVLNSRVALGEQPQFAVRMHVVDADLGRFAQESIPGRQRALGGRVNAHLELSGAGGGMHSWRGSGRVSLREGNLYEAPLVLTTLRTLSLRTPDDGTFSEADVDFRVEGPYLHFDDIRFRGDAVNLRGSGSMTLNRELDLELYTAAARSKTISGMERLLGHASAQLLLIRVTGTLDDPQTRREVVPAVSDALQQIFRDLQPAPVATAAPTTNALRR